MSISQKLLDGLNALVHLKVVTYVGPVETSGELDDLQVKVAPGDESYSIATSIDLGQGDINSVVPPQAWAASGEVVRTFHSEQVESAKAIVDRNLRLIAEVGKSLAEAITELKKADETDA